MNDMNKLPKLTLSIKRPVIDSSLKSKVVVVNKIDKEIESNVVFNSVLNSSNSISPDPSSSISLNFINLLNKTFYIYSHLKFISYNSY